MIDAAAMLMHEPTELRYGTYIAEFVFVLSFLLGYVKSKTFRWILPKTVAQRFPTLFFLILAAIAYSSFFLSLSLILARLHEWVLNYPGKVDLVTSVGTLFVFCMSVFTVWGGLNTLALYFQRQVEFDSFNRFLTELQACRDEIRKYRAPVGEGNSSADKEDTFILVDYAPRIGQISAAETAKEIVLTLKEIAVSGERQKTNCHVIMFDKENLARTYKTWLMEKHDGVETDAESECQTKLQTIEQDVANLESDGIAVWRSHKIYSEHYMVTPTRASQYIVIPDNSGKNRINGESTTVKKRIDFLRDTAVGYMREAITPTIHEGKLQFHTKQYNISSVQITAEGKVVHTIPINGTIGENDIPLPDDLPHRFRIRLVKNIGAENNMVVTTPLSEVLTPKAKQVQGTMGAIAGAVRS